MSKDWGPEGYCKHCNRDVPTAFHDERGRGLLVEHITHGMRCKGSMRAPARRPKHESRNHAFSYKAKTPVRFDD